MKGARMSLADVQELITEAEVVAKRAAEAVLTEASLADRRPLIKHRAVLRVASTGAQPLTGKPHSYSSAEAMVEEDPDYAEHLELLREATQERANLQAEAWAAKLRAELAVRLAGEGVTA